MAFKQIKYTAKEVQAAEKVQEFRGYVAREIIEKHGGGRQSVIFDHRYKERVNKGPVWAAYKRGEGFFPLDRQSIHTLFPPKKERKLQAPDYMVLIYLLLRVLPTSGMLAITNKELAEAIEMPLTKLYSSLKRLKAARIIGTVKKRGGSMALMVSPLLLRHRNKAVLARLAEKFSSLFAT